MSTNGYVPDPVWNDPLPIEIQGNKFIVRELYAGRMKRYLREIVDIMASGSAGAKEAERKAVTLVQTVTAESPEYEAVMAQANSLVENAAVEGFVRTMDQASESVWAIVSESTGLSHEQIDKMPGSAFSRLFGEVVKANMPMIEDFFQQGRALRERLGLNKKQAVATGRPS